MSNINVVTAMPELGGASGPFRIEWTKLGTFTGTTSETKANDSTFQEERLMNNAVAPYDILLADYVGTVKTQTQNGLLAMISASYSLCRFDVSNQTFPFEKRILLWNCDSIYNSVNKVPTSSKFSYVGLGNFSSSAPFIIYSNYAGINLTLNAWGGKIVMI